MKTKQNEQRYGGEKKYIVSEFTQVSLGTAIGAHDRAAPGGLNESKPWHFLVSNSIFLLHVGS